MGFDGVVGEPGAGLAEVLVECLHNEVDGAAVSIADEATVGVASGVEGEGGVVVVVEWTGGFVSDDLEPHPFRDLLDGEVAEWLKVELIHNGKMLMFNG